MRLPEDVKIVVWRNDRPREEGGYEVLGDELDVDWSEQPESAYRQLMCSVYADPDKIPDPDHPQGLFVMGFISPRIKYTYDQKLVMYYNLVKSPRFATLREVAAWAHDYGTTLRLLAEFNLGAGASGQPDGLYGGPYALIAEVYDWGLIRDVVNQYTEYPEKLTKLSKEFDVKQVICRNCKDFRDAGQDCWKCHAPLPDINTCFRCGKWLETNVLKCPSCGNTPPFMKKVPPTAEEMDATGKALAELPLLNTLEWEPHSKGWIKAQHGGLEIQIRKATGEPTIDDYEPGDYTRKGRTLTTSTKVARIIKDGDPIGDVTITKTMYQDLFSARALSIPFGGTTEHLHHAIRMVLTDYENFSNMDDGPMQLQLAYTLRLGHKMRGTGF